MIIIGIIPARYGSTRFPGKPLVDIDGKSMIQRVYEQAKKSVHLSEVVVATDDTRIEQHVKGFNGKVVMTSDQHQSGTDRCFEAMETFAVKADVVINIQGDEPFIHPGQIDEIASCFVDPDVQLATLVKKINTQEELFNVNIPKVLLNKNKEAIYFSRQTIPFIRGKKQEEWLENHTFFKHIGIYAYRASILKEITSLKTTALETSEGLEQLRWIENGYKIKVELTDYESVAVDVPDDLQKLRKFL
ncbi:MAG TPA: 3-deoxy-manno-octulosonate cytidylyltransferase [Bacteroidia bacterium]|nr:3-deoxy-manno-octulosonate cytidylyltransferase [Bacteroidia bacterium]HRG53876.1 3-deoxy-manno-octulosonate cytidylyltransferase [Bacteroidia bacterium]